MPETSDSYSAAKAAKRFAWVTSDKAFGVYLALAASFSNYFTALSWRVIGGLVVALIVLFVLAKVVLNQRRLKLHNLTLEPLSRWAKITDKTDLVDFFEKNSFSEYMPVKIFERIEINDLAVMGNGCGKWTHGISEQKAREKFRQIHANGGCVRFLTSCPIYLHSTAEEKNFKKAKENAESLVTLKKYMDSALQENQRFEVRTYKHVATLRLIILDSKECIVGHYQQDGYGESLDTPLLVFQGVPSKKWGFKNAFQCLFESEWQRASAPTQVEWEAIRNISLNSKSA